MKVLSQRNVSYTVVGRPYRWLLRSRQGCKTCTKGCIIVPVGLPRKQSFLYAWGKRCGVLPATSSISAASNPCYCIEWVQVAGPVA